MPTLYKVLNGKSLEVNGHMIIIHGAKGIKGLTDIVPAVNKAVKKAKKKD